MTTNEAFIPACHGEQTSTGPPAAWSVPHPTTPRSLMVLRVRS